MAINQKYLENLSNGINYKHRYLIVEAEIARVTSNYKLARELYEKALEIVKVNKYIHEEALYREIIYRYYNETGNQEFISYYKNTSMLTYKKWGAIMKYKTFTNKSDNTATKKFDKSIYTVNSLDTEFINSSNINFKSILKFSQAMSSEIVYDELLKKLINILIENSRATKATIINYSKDESLVIASSSTDGDFNLDFYESLVSYRDIPKTIINYVYNTKKIVRIDNAKEDSLFGEDEYVVKNNLKSVICFPLINKRELIGIVYLENKLTKDVFLKEHMDFLSILSTQIAVSIENATFEYVEKQIASFGVSTIKLYESVKDVMKRADDNLYAAKNEGRNKVVK